MLYVLFILTVLFDVALGCNQTATAKDRQTLAELTRRYTSLSTLPHVTKAVKALNSSSCWIYMSSKHQLNYAIWEVWVSGYADNVLCREFINNRNSSVTVVNLKPNTDYQFTITLGGRYYFTTSCKTLPELNTTDNSTQINENGIKNETSNKSPEELTTENNETTKLPPKNKEPPVNFKIEVTKGTEGQKVESNEDNDKEKEPEDPKKEKKINVNINISISLD